MKLIDPNSTEVMQGFKLLNSAKVRFPDRPIEINIFFGFHGYPDDLSPDFKPTVHSSDILAIEGVGWSQRGSELRQRISDGDKTALTEFDPYLNSLGPIGDFWRSVHNAFFESQVQIHYPDVPEGHGLVNKFHSVVSEEAIIAQEVRQVSDDKYIPADLLLGVAKRSFSVHQKRELYMLQHFFPKEVPKSNEVMKITGFFGIIHQAMGTVLAKKAVEQGRDDISVRVNEHPRPRLSRAYDNYLLGEHISKSEMLDYNLAKRD